MVSYAARLMAWDGGGVPCRAGAAGPGVLGPVGQEGDMAGAGLVGRGLRKRRPPCLRRGGRRVLSPLPGAPPPRGTPGPAGPGTEAGLGI